MKTAQHILVTAARLFNEQGERNITASDIALEMDISPGNLYYHYKGKDGILSALFAACYQDLAGILTAPLIEESFFDEAQPLERSWLFLTVAMEVMYSNRFVYHNLTDLMQRYPDIDRGMRRLVQLKRQTTRHIAKVLLAPVNIGAHPQRLEHVADNMAMTMMYWLNFQQFATSSQSAQRLIHHGVLQVLSHCAPYLGDQQSDFYRECELIDARLLDQAPA